MLKFLTQIMHFEDLKPDSKLFIEWTDLQLRRCLDYVTRAEEIVRESKTMALLVNFKEMQGQIPESLLKAFNWFSISSEESVSSLKKILSESLNSKIPKVCSEIHTLKEKRLPPQFYAVFDCDTDEK